MSDALLGLAVLAFIALLMGAGMHYDSLVAKANLSEQRANTIKTLQKDIENLKAIKNIGDKKVSNVDKEKLRLERENAEYKKLVKELSKRDPSLATYLTTPVPDGLSNVLCKHVGSYKGSTDCSGAPGEVSKESRAPEVREKSNK